MDKRAKRESWRASLVQKTAKTTGFSTRYVRMVINGDRENQTVMGIYMTLQEGENTLLKNVKNTLAGTI
jgi:hypothetical protein